jgi:glycosyltransferase involved in cell wall biosynthesis/predicted flap endonuclease-1-like 5' DNA nuclease
MTRIKMTPDLESFGNEENGIRRVIEAYLRYLPEFGYQVVGKTDQNFDLLVSHAGAAPDPDVMICHGLYWTADFNSPKWEREVNRSVIAAARYARFITVPSAWVGEVFRRDMHLIPTVVPHGIEADMWKHTYDSQGYALWNKNRAGVDVCSTHDSEALARLRPKTNFLSTFASHEAPTNYYATGLMPHADMKRTVQQAGVYLSTVKETFGIGVLEAMAAGVPVLGWNFGGNRDLVQHGVNGYLAEFGDYQGLARGLDYCLEHRSVLGRNGQAIAATFTWQKAVQILSNVLSVACMPVAATVSVIIPCYNYADKVERAIRSAQEQTYPAQEIIVVDDGSSPEQSTRIKAICDSTGVTYLHKENGGVATARNYGIKYATTPYVCCLDADDAIAPKFLEVCVDALVHDPSLGVAYTGLQWIKGDGTTGMSQWPGQYDYDAFLRRQNQVPTCCVFRRDMWERLGGYDQRYAPGGAGAEDAEFFLRAGAMGFGGKKVTEEGLFIYSWGTGMVSGDKNYREVDWLELHPWARDGQHPFASLATPKSFSHPVRQYDQPLVSVVIPVGPGHEKEVRNALDSLESQTLRQWEAICVFDNWDGDVKKISDLEDVLSDLEVAYPFVRTIVNKDPHKGAGWARNKGAAAARAPFLLFLDADDWLSQNAIEKLYSAWKATGGIVYSDYVGKAVIEERYAKELQDSGRLLSYNQRTHEAVMRYKSAEYDCARAQAQPDPKDMYIWNLISSFVPRSWHIAVGGFDERMPSWEDWDYWIRMARAGYCFYRVPEQLVVYRFTTGSRRETGLHEYPNLLQYLKDKYQEKGGKLMPCTSCGGGNNNSAQASVPVQSVVERQIAVMSDEDFVLCDYRHGNLGQHSVIGPVTHTNYGYRGGGEQFYVHRLDIEAAPDLFVPVHQAREVGASTPEPAAPKPLGVSAMDEPVVEEELPQPKIKTKPPVLSEPQTGNKVKVSRAKKDQAEKPAGVDLQKVPGISDSVARELNGAGVYTVEDLRKMDIESLNAIKGIGRLRAETIYEYLHMDKGNTDE